MKIGIMSFAHLHAESYIENLRAAPGVEMIGLADEEPERGAQFAKQFNAHLFPSYEALIAAKPDGVIVCSENNKHRPLVEMAAEAGVNVLCEKPIATTLADARAIVDVCARHKVKLLTAFPMRFSAPLLQIKERLDTGELGQVYCVNGTNNGECPKHLRAWFADKELAGGGAVVDHTVHLADILRWYLQSEVVEVYAQTNRITYADEANVETGGLLMLTFANGVFATIDCTWSKPPYYPTWGGLAFELVTNRGAVRVDGFKQNLTIYQHSLRRPTYGFWGSDSNQAMVDEFVAAIREDRAPSVTGEDGLRAVEVFIAAYESATSGKPVRLNHS